MTKPKLPNSSEITLTFVTASGPGGQNVNKVATAAQLRFNVMDSTSLPPDVKERLIALLGKRITQHGDLIIKANRHRTQERNKQDALARLYKLVEIASIPRKKRKKTKPTRASKERRLNSKKIQGDKKKLRTRKDFA